MNGRRRTTLVATAFWAVLLLLGYSANTVSLLAMVLAVDSLSAWARQRWVRG